MSDLGTDTANIIVQTSSDIIQKLALFITNNMMKGIIKLSPLIVKGIIETAKLNESLKNNIKLKEMENSKEEINCLDIKDKTTLEEFKSQSKLLALNYVITYDKKNDRNNILFFEKDKVKVTTALNRATENVIMTHNKNETFNLELSKAQFEDFKQYANKENINYKILNNELTKPNEKKTSIRKKIKEIRKNKNKDFFNKTVSDSLKKKHINSKAKELR